MKNETTTPVDYVTLYRAVDHALANFLGTDDVDEGIVELVAHRIAEHWDNRDSGYFEDILASTSTYVQCDLDELELADYVGELETQLDDYFSY